jgi:hypothetical protein
MVKLKKDLEFIKDDAQGILLYGSCAMNTANNQQPVQNSNGYDNDKEEMA